MKRILFISRSRLCHNLLQAVVTLIPKKAEPVCVESIDEALSLPRRGAPFRLILVDWNAVAEEKNGVEETAKLNGHRLLADAARVLLHGHGADPSSCKGDPSSFAKASADKSGRPYFSAFHAKPFLADELAKIIEDHL